MRQFAFLLVLALSALAVFKSGSLADDSNGLDKLDFKKVDSTLRNYGYVSRNHLWNSHVISVCWENPSPDNLHARILIESTVEQSWEKYSSLSITGWENTCKPAVSGVHIFLVDDTDGPRSLIGNRLDQENRGVRLNVTFQNWGKSECAGRIDDCIRTVSMHEFGHVLGLVHESLRLDAPEACKKNALVLNDKSGVGDADDLSTPYDADSIMNYCNKIYERSAALSSGDQKVARLMYP